MEPSPLEISNLRLRLRCLSGQSTSEELFEILDEIGKLGQYGGQLIPDMITVMKRGVYIPSISLVRLIAFFKNGDFLEAALQQNNGGWPLHFVEKSELLKAGFQQFQQPLLDELFRIFERDDVPWRSEIVDALAVAGTASAMDALRVIEYRTAARIPELSSELENGNPVTQATNQLQRGESLAGRMKFLAKVRETIGQIGNRPDPQNLDSNAIAFIQGGVSSSVQPINALLQNEEGAQLEFKSALRWDDARGVVDAKLERRALCVIAAFANAKGGTLLIGINPQKQIVGLNKDYASLKGNRDEFERHLSGLISRDCGKVFSVSELEISFHKEGEAEICQVIVGRASEAIWMTKDREQEFWVRSGNANSLLKGSDITDYFAKRFVK